MTKDRSLGEERVPEGCEAPVCYLFSFSCEIEQKSNKKTDRTQERVLLGSEIVASLGVEARRRRPGSSVNDFIQRRVRMLSLPGDGEVMGEHHPKTTT